MARLDFVLAVAALAVPSAAGYRLFVPVWDRFRVVVAVAVLAVAVDPVVQVLEASVRSLLSHCKDSG
jgi:hypothetical protein